MKTWSKKKKKAAALMAAASLLVLAACYTVFITPLLKKEQWIYKEETVERGTLKVGVTESGSLEYGISSILYDLDLDIDNEDEEEDEDEDSVQKYLKIETIYVAVGQRISEGDALMQFTQDSVSDVRRLLESALVDAKAEYADAQSAYNLSVIEAKTTYDTQKVEQGYASSIYKEASASVDNEISSMQVALEQRQANISSLEEKITDAQEAYDDLLEDWENAKAAMEGAGTDNTENFLSIQSTYLNMKTKYETAKEALEQAQQNLQDNAEQIERLQKKITAAQAKRTLDKLEVKETYQESEINGENAEVTYQAQLESLKETLQEAEDEKTKIEEQLQEFEAFVGEDGILYAQEAGIITELPYAAGDRLETTGLLIAYATPGDMTITVNVTQEDVVDLAVGDAVDITFAAYQDTAYDGVIQSIDTTAVAADSNTVSYAVVISVSGDTSLLYGGMTADIVFVTEEKEDVLFVSRKAIVEENGKSYVYRKTALGGKELTEVETGVSNGVSMEIVSGLEEGDTIYLASRVSSETEVTEGTEDASKTSGADAQEAGDFPAGEGMTFPDGMEFDKENRNQKDGDFGGMPGAMMDGGGRK